MTYFNLNNEGQTAPVATAVPAAFGNIDMPHLHENDDDPATQAAGLLDLYHSGAGFNYEAARPLILSCIDEILEHWLPDGEQQGRQYKACNPTRNDNEAGSFQINTTNGLWADFATEDSGGDLISLVKYLDGCEFASEAGVRILEFIAGIEIDPVEHIKKQKVAAKARSAEIYPYVRSMWKYSGTI
jgi:hypothetical protein